MFDFLTSWTNLWHPGAAHPGKMPLTEKEPGERVEYPYPLKKLRLSEALEIAYVDEGKGDVLLFVHGMAGGIPSWGKNLSVLRKGYRCIALDLPGHGYSSRGDFPYTMAFYTGVVLAFMQKLGLTRVTLVGHSMGGQIAIHAGLKDPELIQRLVLVAPSGIEPYTAAEKQTLINMAAGVVGSGNAFTYYRFNYLLGFCNDSEAAGELIRRLAFFKNEAAIFGKTLLRSVEAMLLESVNHRLDQLTQPCLVVVGKQDRVSPYQYLRAEDFPDIVAREARKLRRGNLLVVEPCGHFVQYQRPKAFNNAVLEFLQEKDGTGR
jgi:pimeloyl-ACP methyl ester carboxylesterase